MNYYPNLILEALAKVRYPGNGQDIVSAGMVEDDIRIDGNKISFSLIFDKPNDPFAKSLVKACEQAILTYVDAEAEIKGNIAIKFKQVAAKPEKALTGVKHVIAVSSGKGGVGKSTISANLAVALAKQGYKVGLLDADIYGPSMPKMFGVEDTRAMGVEVDGRELIEPIEVMGIKLLSIGFFVDPGNAIIWRGAMASNAIKQLINDSNWGELDYLVMDLPPGTSDIHLTLIQAVDIDGAIVVSTPQQVALADAIKGLMMFQTEKINIPILGLVENMAWFTPAELPENRYYIFGKEGCKTLAEERNIPLLAQIPLVQGICDSGDAGKPIATAENSVMSQAFHNLASAVTSRLEEV